MNHAAPCARRGAARLLRPADGIVGMPARPECVHIVRVRFQRGLIKLVCPPVKSYLHFCITLSSRHTAPLPFPPPPASRPFESPSARRCCDISAGLQLK